MALETLKDVNKIDGFDVVVMDELRVQFPEHFNEEGGMDYKWFEEKIRPKNFIYIRHDKNSIAFTIQNGPVKENGVNGCQVDTIVEAAQTIIEGLHKNFPSDENGNAIYHLKEALKYLRLRKKNREDRGVEGYNKL